MQNGATNTNACQTMVKHHLRVLVYVLVPLALVVAFNSCVLSQLAMMCSRLHKALYGDSEDVRRFAEALQSYSRANN